MNIFLWLGVFQAAGLVACLVVAPTLKYPWLSKVNSASEFNLRYLFGLLRYWTLGAVVVYVQFRVGEAIVNYFGWS